ncbi:MAG: YtxH domain-containing protein [Thermodesulfobacteriota bacterium]
MDKDNGSGGSLLTFLTGTIIGAGLALLYAPKSGQETREMITDYGNDIRERSRRVPDNMRDSADTMIDQGRDLIDRGKTFISQGNEMVEQGKTYLDEKKQNLTDAIEAGKEAMIKEKEELSASMATEE